MRNKHAVDLDDLVQEMVDKGIDEHWDDVFEPMRNRRDSNGIVNFLMREYKADYAGVVSEEELIERLTDHVEEGFST